MFTMMSEPLKSFTAVLTEPQIERLRGILQEKGFEFVSREHTLFAATGPQVQIAVYAKSGKVLIQGKGTHEFVEFEMEPRVLQQARLGYETVMTHEMHTPHFGIDESGKGDYFGPLVVAGVYVDATLATHYAKLGVTDSKKIAAAGKIRELADRIRAAPGAAYYVLLLSPRKYNELYAQFNNLNHMLAWAHATVIEQLLLKVPECPRTLSDQFANELVLKRAVAQKKLNIQLQQRTKGESDIAVAAASILAREQFVKWIDKASADLGMILPLGASRSVLSAGRRLIQKNGFESLSSWAKYHFKTTQQLSEGEN